jgi:hypothetical protein
MQNLKNFIRHGKNARDPKSPAEPQLSNVHAQQHRGAHPPAVPAISEPNVAAHKPLQGYGTPGQDYSAAAVDNRGVAAKAGHAAAGAVDDKQKRERQQKEYDSSVLERIVAEERESKGKLPRYPGLDRYTLIEKMGDGAFSNVYRAKDNDGQYPEVAIKVVRKFEMNSTQVCCPRKTLHSLALAVRPSNPSFAHHLQEYMPTSGDSTDRPKERYEAYGGAPRSFFFFHPPHSAFVFTSQHISIGMWTLANVDRAESKHSQGSSNYAQPGPPQHRSARRIQRVKAILLHHPRVVSRWRTFPPDCPPDLLQRGLVATRHQAGCRLITVPARGGRSCASVSHIHDHC